MNKKIWISAGELSGDMHGALLASALLKEKPELQLMGMGGEEMKEAGVKNFFHIKELSVMGITEVLSKLLSIIKLLSKIEKSLEKERPSAIIVIDAPDFNFRVIKIARKLNIPVYYYISPKVWAWRSGRAKFIKKNVHKLISILPFEIDFYKKYGMEIDYIGNPLVETVNYEKIKSIDPIEGRIGILPGSRKKEITALMPAFGKAAEIMTKTRPDLKFVCIKASNMEENFLRSFWPADLPLTISEEANRWKAMRKCEMLIVASGTVSLESALAGVPTLVTYKVSPLSYCVAKMLVKTPYISLPNLIMGKAIFPELIQADCDPEALSEKVLSWLNPENKGKIFSQIKDDLNILREKVGEAGAAKRAARLILSDMQ